MPRPKNMTPEQTEAWKKARNEKEKAKRASDPQYRAKVFACNSASNKKRRLESPEIAERRRAASRKYGQRPDAKRKNAERMNRKYQSDPEHAKHVVEYQKKLRLDPPRYAEKLAYQKSYNPIRRDRRRLNAEYKAFLSRIQIEEQSDGKTDL